MEGRRQAAERADDARLVAAWYSEALARMKRLPSLETLLVRPDDRLEPQSPGDMLSVMEAIKAAGGDVTIEVEEV